LAEMGQGPDDFDWVRDRPGHDRRYAIDSTKLRRELGWAPAHTDYAAGLRATIEWYRNYASWARCPRTLTLLLVCAPPSSGTATTRSGGGAPRRLLRRSTHRWGSRELL